MAPCSAISGQEKAQRQGCLSLHPHKLDVTKFGIGSHWSRQETIELGDDERYLGIRCLFHTGQRELFGRREKFGDGSGEGKVT